MNADEKKRFGTVCSGIGAPELAASRLAGWKPIFSSEIENFPNAVREFRFPGIPNLGDMTKFKDWPERCRCRVYVPNHKVKFKLHGIEIIIEACPHCGGIRIDALIGGTPCQSFSVAGLRAGMADPRGNLALTFLAIVERYAPRWVLWENVPGVHSSWSDAANRGETEASREIGETLRGLAEAAGFDADAAGCFREVVEVDQTNDFDCFLSGLEQLGYGVAHAICDAQFFGVAQRRRRVFVVGHIGGQWQRAAAVLFDAESLRGNPAPRREKRQGTSGISKISFGIGSKASCADGVTSNESHVSGGPSGMGIQEELSHGLRAGRIKQVFSAETAPCIGASGRGFERAGETRGQDPVIVEMK